MSTFESVVERVRANLTSYCSVEPEAAVWVACSGGADSVALAHALHAAHPACSLAGLVFIDHGLRDVSSERRAAEQCARTLQVAFIEQRVELESSGNLQDSARAARYQALEANVPHGAFIATGHTLTDQAETVLQRLTRGSGIRGLQGIQARRGRWIRPLLDVRREETRNLGFYFADDPTNTSLKFARNRIREKVLPHLLQENSNAEAALAAVARQAHTEMQVVDLLMSALGDDLDVSGLPSDWVHTLSRWHYKRHFPDAPPPRTRAMGRLVEHLQQGLKTRHFSIGNGVRATAYEGRLIFSGDDDSRRSVVLHGPGAYALQQQVIKVAQRGYKGDEDEIETDNSVFLDASNLIWPLVLRPHQPSDRLSIPGQEAQHRVRDAFRTAGISWDSKRRKNVLIDGLGRVLWVGGIGCTSIATLTEHTVRCVVVTFPNASDLLI